MSDERVWPGPRDLIEYLKQPGRKKARNQFARGDGRCCLGHYADMCGLEYPEDQGIFDSVCFGVEAVLPKGHWLFASVGGRPLQDRLARINDASGGFDKAIRFLEKFAAEYEAAE